MRTLRRDGKPLPFVPLRRQPRRAAGNRAGLTDTCRRTHRTQFERPARMARALCLPASVSRCCRSAWIATCRWRRWTHHDTGAFGVAGLPGRISQGATLPRSRRLADRRLQEKRRTLTRCRRVCIRNLARMNWNNVTPPSADPVVVRAVFRRLPLQPTKRRPVEQNVSHRRRPRRPSACSRSDRAPNNAPSSTSASSSTSSSPG